MPELEPITREEKLLDGEDLTPITRKEQFIKRIYDKTQEIPEPITREEMFLKKAGEGSGGDVTIEQLDVSANGTYSESGKAYSPVVVNVPQPTLTTLDVTENGTYTAPSGTAYDEVNVNVPLPQNAYLLKSVANLPRSIASFNDGEDMVMPSLKVAIEPVQEGSGDPSPTNVRPISGWNVVNVGVVGSNLIDITSFTPTYTLNGITYTINTDGSVVANGTATGRSQVYWSIPQDIAKTFANKKLSGLKAHEGCSLFLELNGTPYTNYGIDTGEGATIDSSIENATTTVNFVIRIASGTTVSNYVVIPRITDEHHAYTIDLDGTRYGGEVDVVNGIGREYKEYPSYNGETLIGPWISDRDEYAEGTTPTIGAQVVDKGDISTFNTIPTAVKSLRGVNNVYANTGNIKDAEYFSKEV